MITLNGKTVTPTHFPDRTTQVWKIDLSDKYRIVWNYENDAEIFQLMQLLDLVCDVENDEHEPEKVTLFVPYFPYARQDKDVNNTSTFALKTLIAALTMYMPTLTIETIDIHSSVARDYCIELHEQWDTIDRDDFYSFINYYPQELIDEVNTYDAIVFPDAGAKERYSKLFNEDIKKYSLTKVRDQQTGEILGMEFEDDNVVLENDSVVVVDDICDGGRTFLGAYDIILKYYPSIINLVITHGIFSNENQLRDLSLKYDEIITTDTLYSGFTIADWYAAAKQSTKYGLMSDLMKLNSLRIVNCKELKEFAI